MQLHFPLSRSCTFSVCHAPTLIFARMLRENILRRLKLSFFAVNEFVTVSSNCGIKENVTAFVRGLVEDWSGVLCLMPQNFPLGFEATQANSQPRHYVCCLKYGHLAIASGFVEAAFSCLGRTSSSLRSLLSRPAMCGHLLIASCLCSSVNP